MSPGLNAAIRGVAKPAMSDFHIEVIGIEKGFRGLVENHARVLHLQDVSGILSLGGTMTLFLAATDDRVAVAVVSGFLSSWGEAHKVPWNMCGSQVMVGMLGQIEHVDLGALIAPRPLLVETGTEDLIFPVAAASESVGQLRAIYQRYGASDRIVHDVFVGDHQWHGLAAYPFLDHWLHHTPSA